MGQKGAKGTRGASGDSVDGWTESRVTSSSVYKGIFEIHTVGQTIIIRPLIRKKSTFYEKKTII